MTYAEAAFALTKLPDSIYLDMQEAAKEAELCWADEPGISVESVLIAKAASLEVTLIFAGALPIVQGVRRRSRALLKKPSFRQ